MAEPADEGILCKTCGHGTFPAVSGAGQVCAGCGNLVWYCHCVVGDRREVVGAPPDIVIRDAPSGVWKVQPPAYYGDSDC